MQNGDGEEEGHAGGLRLGSWPAMPIAARREETSNQRGKHRLFSSKNACAIAITAIDLKVKTSAAFLAGRIERTTTRALRARRRKGHLGLVPLAAGT
jgi:hypothetical protein